jgi:hypothetical protein
VVEVVTVGGSVVGAGVVLWWSLEVMKLCSVGDAVAF